MNDGLCSRSRSLRQRPIPALTWLSPTRCSFGFDGKPAADVIRQWFTGATASLLAPTNLSAQTNGLAVTLEWSPSAGATSYQLEAGTGAGLTNVFTGDVGNVTSLQANGPVGTFFTRVRARPGATVSAPFNEVSFTLGSVGPCTAPGAPTGLSFTKTGPLLALSWTASAGAATYRLQAGTAADLTNAFNSDIGAVTSLQFNIGALAVACITFVWQQQIHVV